MNQELDFIVRLVDQVTGPAAGIADEFQNITGAAEDSYRQMAYGAAGLVGSAVVLQQTLQPAIEMNKALGEVESLGVMDDALSELKNTALDFSVEFGESATDFVGSAYDIQSAIAGLNSAELSAFTQSSNILAKATKSDAGTITDYMGTMYGIFENEALAIGKSEWVNQVAGQTAAAVQMFKTTGGDMAAAFSSLGAEAQANGIGMAEQMAIMGQLQATMSGAEAGTKYRAFLGGVGKAQDKLGLSFTDSHGQLLPMLDILDSLHGKFGDTLSVAESVDLKNAFGSAEAVGMIKLLMKNTQGLSDNIQTLGQQTGIEKAMEMAQAQVDPWEKAGAAANALRVVIGSALLPMIEPVIESMIEAAQAVLTWTELFPHLTQAAGFAVLAIAGLSAAMAVVSIVAGLSGAAFAGVRMAWLALKTVGWALHGMFMALKTVMFAFQIAAWLVGGPVVLIVVAIAALVGAIVAAVYYWDEITTAIGNTDTFKNLIIIFDALKVALSGVFDWMKTEFPAVFGFISDLIDNFFQGFADIKNIVVSLFSSDESNAGDIEPFEELRRPERRNNTVSVKEELSAMGGGGTSIGTFNNITEQQMTPEVITHVAQMAG